MPLQPPNLDDRQFDELFEGAKARIPRYLPEWTDWNDSDPGITLLQLQAWLTETILYRLNQVPDLNYIKFLQLLGVQQRPAQPAQAQLTFTLKASVNQPQVLIPDRTMVGVADRDLEPPLFFETEQTLVAIPAQLSRLVRDLPDHPDPRQRTVDVTQANAVDDQVFTPFSDAEVDQGQARHGAKLYLAFRSPLPFSREEIGLHIYLADVGQALLAPVVGRRCGPALDRDDTPTLSWQWWNGVDWSDLEITADQTQSLTQSGQIYFRVTGQIPAVPPSAVTQRPAPSPAAEDSPLYYWLRVGFNAGTYAQAPKIDRILTNTVTATAAQTVFDEAVGASDGTPNQTMTLRHSPILAAPPLQLEVDEGSGPQPWTVVADFYGSGPEDAVYGLDQATGQITFGDGRRGRIPVAGQFNVIARQYRYGGGQVGNVGANTIIELATPCQRWTRSPTSDPQSGALIQNYSVTPNCELRGNSKPAVEPLPWRILKRWPRRPQGR